MITKIFLHLKMNKLNYIFSIIIIFLKFNLHYLFFLIFEFEFILTILK